MENKIFVLRLSLGSGVLSGLILDIGLLKIIWGGIFPISSPCGGSNYAGSYPNPEGKANLYLA